ncbi:hypothetical protein BH18ACI4_BH18ACI4_26650 [soil metagenome]
MATPEEAAAAIEQFNGKYFGGRNLTVIEASRERFPFYFLAPGTSFNFMRSLPRVISTSYS